MSLCVWVQEPDRQVINGQHLLDLLTPLDHGHPDLEELREIEIERLGNVVESIDIEMVQFETARLITIHQGERRAGHPFGDPEPGAETLGETCLAGPEVAGQHEEIAEGEVLGNDSGKRLCVLRAPGGEGNHGDQVMAELFGLTAPAITAASASSSGVAPIPKWSVKADESMTKSSSNS